MKMIRFLQIVNQHVFLYLLILASYLIFIMPMAQNVTAFWRRIILIGAVIVLFPLVSVIYEFDRRIRKKK
jgi:Zn-dependent membrane protease YugP